MAESYTIPITADTADIDRAIDQVADRLDNVADRASSIDIGGRGGGMRSSGGSRGGLTNDPWARHDFATARLAEARATGLSGDALRPFEYAAARSARAVESADRMISGRPDRSSQGGGGLMLGALGRFAGPMALAYAGFAMARGGYESADAMGGAYHTGGGSVGETGSVTGIGRFLGRDPSSAVGAAVQFGAALHNSTYGAGYFRSRGVVDLGGLSADKDTNYIKAVKLLAEEPDRGTATRVARDVGLTDELWLRDLPSQRRRSVMGGMSDNQSDAERRRTAAAKADFAEIGSFWDNAKRDLWDLTGGNVRELIDMPSRARAAGAYQGRLQRARRIAAQAGVPFSQAEFDRETDDEGKLLPAFREKDSKVSRWSHDPSWRPAGYKEKNSTADAPRTTAGISGGGPRAQASLPPSAKAQQLSENLEGYGRYVGGYYG